MNIKVQSKWQDFIVTHANSCIQKITIMSVWLTLKWVGVVDILLVIGLSRSDFLSFYYVPSRRSSHCRHIDDHYVSFEKKMKEKIENEPK